MGNGSLKPLLVGTRLEYDDVAWERCYDTFQPWKERLFDHDNLRAIGRLIAETRKGVPDELCSPKQGSFNVMVQMKFEDGGSAIMRFPRPGFSVFPEEKVKQEVEVLRFLQAHTNIPVPYVLQHGITDESPGHLGPYIIMEYIKNDHDFVDAIIRPDILNDDRPVIDPDVSLRRLESIYAQMADVLLQISQHTFPKIGSISRINPNDEFDDKFVVSGRPLTLNMNELVQLGNYPPNLLTQAAFKTASRFYESLADQHLIHLSTQRNDIIKSAEDCHAKYIARCLFRKLAREGRLTIPDTNGGPFRLYCDDLRPANVLANKNFELVGVIDFEYSYVAPSEFIFSPPDWLILEKPEYWDGGLDDWIQTYEPRLNTFLSVLRRQEQEAISRGTLPKNQILLSDRMRQSWETGDFWVNYAARRSWAFDMIYWAKIDRRFFSEGSLEDRLRLLTAEERAGIDAFVERKMAEKQGERILTDWKSTDSRMFLVP